jgi:TDG/mug DNA glycosylase family protein
MSEAQALSDVVGERCEILFCGINPGLMSGSTGYHFARPGNRFWKALALSGLTDRLLEPSEQRMLPTFGLGVTNLVGRVSATAKEVNRDELVAGGVELRSRVERYQPTVLAVLGLGAWRIAVDRRAELGRQPTPFGGATLFVLPNPSGLQARYQLPELAEMFAALGVARDELAADARHPGSLSAS